MSNLMDRRTMIASSLAGALATGPRLRLGGAPPPPEARPLPAATPPAIFDVRAFGAAGDGQTFDDHAIVAAVTAAARAGGGIVFFPPAAYRIADHAVVSFQDVKHVALIGYGALLFNDVGTGANGLMLRFGGTTEDVLLEGLAFDANSSNPSSFDDILSFENDAGATNRGITIRKCEFRRASHKHLHFEGVTEHVLIEDCFFQHAQFNTLPTANNSFAAVFFYWRADQPSSFVDITIRQCVFDSNWMFAIAMNQTDAFATRAFRRITIADNVFRDGTAGVLVRGEHVSIVNNLFERMGVGNIVAQYVWDPTLARYMSRMRRDAGQPARTDTTMTPNKLGVVFTGDGRHVRIEGNTFVRCGDLQRAAPGDTDPRVPLVIDTGAATFARVVGNFIDESTSTGPTPPQPLVHCGGPHSQLCDNVVVFGEAYPPQHHVVRVDTPEATAHGNRMFAPGDTPILLFDPAGRLDREGFVLASGNNVYAKLGVNVAPAGPSAQATLVQPGTSF